VSRPPVVVTSMLLLAGIVVDVVVDYSLFPGFGALIGLIGCTLIVVVSKWLGSAFLERPEDQYPDEVPPDVQPDAVGDAAVLDGAAQGRAAGGDADA
jgi:hypothetical protein